MKNVKSKIKTKIYQYQKEIFPPPAIIGESVFNSPPNSSHKKKKRKMFPLVMPQPKHNPEGQNKTLKGSSFLLPRLKTQRETLKTSLQSLKFF